jgi:hypothetical protein
VALLQPAADVWRRLAATGEIASSRSLQALYWALLGGFALTFHEWTRSGAFTRDAVVANRHLCWPYFQSCAKVHVLSGGLGGRIPQTLVYAVLLAVLAAGALAAWRARWDLALLALAPAFAWKLAVHHLFTMQLIANYHFFHLALCFVFLFARDKLWFLRRTLGLLYLLSAVVKLDAGWLRGTYFSSLSHGLPLVPDALIPVATNAVLLLETAGTLALFSANRRVRLGAVAAFALFHLYSTILVAYPYPLFCLPPLLVLFALDEPAVRPALSPRAVPGGAVLALLVLGQCIPAAIRGDAALTLEGNGFGLHMFEANHQCVSTATVRDRAGGAQDASFRSTRAGNRCDPYAQWFTLREICRRNAGRLERVEWTFDHSINGGPFYRIVDVPDACALAYRPFSHNAWIRLPEDGAEVRGTPPKNSYR